MHILIIEDEKKIASFIKRGLKEEGYAVTVANDGGEGLFFVQNNEYDLILLDVMLPTIDGVTLCKSIRERGKTVPVIMLTAKDSIKDKVKGLDSGANDYLTKPFAFEELLARIRAQLRPVGSSVVTKLHVDDLEMDLLSHLVTRAGIEIELTTRECSLLEYLMRNTGTIVTRTMIFEHVWEINFDTATNIIDVYINYLRRKIDSNSAKKIIYTIRGRGYMLKA